MPENPKAKLYLDWQEILTLHWAILDWIRGNPQDAVAPDLRRKIEAARRDIAYRPGGSEPNPSQATTKHFCLRCECEFASSVPQPKQCRLCHSKRWNLPRQRSPGAGRPRVIPENTL